MKIVDNELIVHWDNAMSAHQQARATTNGLEAPALESAAFPEPNGWDKAHTVYRQNKNHPELDFVEPDYRNVFAEPFPNLYYQADQEGILESSGSREAYCALEIKYDSDWTRPENDAKQIWHLTDQFSQLQNARDAIAALLAERDQKTVVRIAHFDTGYDPEHVTFPKEIIREDLQRNFTGSGSFEDAADDGVGANGGHGCGTLSILAGKDYENDYGFTGAIGLGFEHGIEVVPIRIARSVVLFRSKAFEEALQYVISLYDDPEKRCHLITMSMGGAPTRDWAKLVNKAYDKGIFMVTAAGNNFGGVTPRTLVYPARFNRVVAACGVTYNLTPYFKFELLPQLRIMQGNYGPRRFMRTAMAAFTPNVPWAKFGCKDKVSLSGAGTSSATPQIAAAAALYYQKYYQEIEALDEGWKKVEVIRKALFSSASKDNPDTALYFGNGILKANAMFDVQPLTAGLKKEEKDTLFLPVLRLLGEIITAESVQEASDAEEEMFELEIRQLILGSEQLQQLLDHEEKRLEDLSPNEKKELIRIILTLPEASQALKDRLAPFLV